MQITGLSKASVVGHVPQLIFFFFNDTATTEIYTLSLHDALPICVALRSPLPDPFADPSTAKDDRANGRSEEHTSELQSRGHLVCRLLLEKKKKKKTARSIQYNHQKFVN